MRGLGGAGEVRTIANWLDCYGETLDRIESIRIYHSISSIHTHRTFHLTFEAKAVIVSKYGVFFLKSRAENFFS